MLDSGSINPCQIFPQVFDLARVSSHALACDLDHLERHIDWYGSVVAKVPDVWGQARLTKYREEFELLMAADKDTFKLNLQGSLGRSDQTYFANGPLTSPFG